MSGDDIKGQIRQPILIASGNKHKVAELSAVAANFSLRLCSPADACAVFGLSEPPEVEENESTFQANALLKARAYAKWSGLFTIGDDSGLEVTALGMQPGIFSARYAGVGASDEAKVDKLLAELQNAQQNNPHFDRSANFRCALVMVSPDGQLLASSESKLFGHILHEPRGTNGFGYDPIVFLDSLGCALAEVDFSVVCSKGFRAIAAKILFEKVCGEWEMV